MSTETYSLASDFGGNLNSRQLHDEIDANNNIVPNIIGVVITGDVVDIIFDSGLNAGEQTTLNGLISAHTPVTIVTYDNTIKLTPKNSNISNTSYSRVDTFVYEGSDTIGTIKKISGIGYMDSGVTNFSIKLYDKTNGLIIAESSFTDTTESILSITPINNVPTGQALIEILVKKTGGNGNQKAYCETVTIYF